MSKPLTRKQEKQIKEKCMKSQTQDKTKPSTATEDAAAVFHATRASSCIAGGEIMNDCFDFDKADLCRIAYHEAGHATMGWFFGRPIKHIQIDRFGLSGRTIIAGPLWPKSDMPKKELLACKRQAGRQDCMVGLAGPAAESRVEERCHPPGFTQLQDALTPGLTATSNSLGSKATDDIPEWFWPYMGMADVDIWDDDIWDDFPMHLSGQEDVELVREITAALFGERRSESVLIQTLQWTEEAISHPRLWTVVESLAQRLEGTKRTLSGEVAVKLMWDAWGGSPATGVPFTQLGEKWRRRFSLFGQPPAEEA